MPLDNKTQPPFPKSSIEFNKSQDFANTYSNNVFFESSLWDLRMIFGQNDQQLGPNAVVQHTAVTIPWPQVKVMKYFLDSQLVTYEAQNGRIHIPPNIIPAFPDELPKEFEKLDPKAKEVWDAVRANYDSFIKANPEASADGANKSKKS
jgi:hypothetical protein